ncbi:LOB domain-containing protein 4 [Senna tora]|uniref:LOB domain-containing protein 4 n=1 Tax=Senna tora TaxID=362788 RepID=A0A834XIT0_9FABA|nr:LOB domain-containing protein 4 [Senna tora]
MKWYTYLNHLDNVASTEDSMNAGELINLIGRKIWRKNAITVTSPAKHPTSCAWLVGLCFHLFGNDVYASAPHIPIYIEEKKLLVLRL